MNPIPSNINVVLGREFCAPVIGAPLVGLERALDEFVRIAGDSMTGPLILFGDPTSLRMAATKNYVDTRPVDGGEY